MEHFLCLFFYLFCAKFQRYLKDFGMKSFIYVVSVLCHLCAGAYSNLLRLSDTLKRNPGSPHHGIPDEAFVPHLNNEAKVQPVDLTEEKGK